MARNVLLFSQQGRNRLAEGDNTPRFRRVLAAFRSVFSAFAPMPRGFVTARQQLQRNRRSPERQTPAQRALTQGVAPAARFNGSTSLTAKAAATLDLLAEAADAELASARTAELVPSLTAGAAVAWLPLG